MTTGDAAAVAAEGGVAEGGVAEGGAAEGGGAGYRAVNLAAWDERAPAHAVAPEYDVPAFLADPGFLSGVVRFDRPLLGDVSGLRGVHLQCHIGTDTVSLARLGAVMTGLDFSPVALEQARDLARRTSAAADFVQADVYEAAEVLGAGEFDLVYTGIGALCWLPDIRRWAGVVARLLRPGGRLFIREGHPVLWALADPLPDGLLALEYPYFERVEPVAFTDSGTYVTTDAVFEQHVSYSWNHGLGEIVSALMAEGMAITGLAEHDSVPWDAMPGQMEQIGGGEWRLADRPWRLPHSYTLQAVKGPPE
jgi:SAM-dependent methyltransferase